MQKTAAVGVLDDSFYCVVWLELKKWAQTFPKRNWRKACHPLEAVPLSPEKWYSPWAARIGISKAIVQNHDNFIPIITFFLFPPLQEQGKEISSIPAHREADFSACINQHSSTDAMEARQLTPIQESGLLFFISRISAGFPGRGWGRLQQSTNYLFIWHPIPADKPTLQDHAHRKHS